MTVMHTMHWIVTLVKPLPSTVAPRKVQKGISSQPHAMPHMSKAAFLAAWSGATASAWGRVWAGLLRQPRASRLLRARSGAGRSGLGPWSHQAG